MPPFWKKQDGSWRKGALVICVLFLASAIYGFAKEGWRGGIKDLLLVVAIAALPDGNTPDQGRANWYGLRSPRYLVGIVAAAAWVALFVSEVVGDIRQ